MLSRLRPRTPLLVEGLLCLLLLLGGYRARVHLGRDWTFNGADSFAYMGGAMELLTHHTFALRRPHWIRPQQPNTPPAYCRMPGYSFLLAVTTRDTGPGYDEMIRKAKPVQAVIDMLTALCAFLIARRLAGRLAGFLALLVVVADPFLALFSASILSETLATFLTTLTLLFVFLSCERRGWALAVAGAVLALAVLTRVDSLVLLPCLLLPWLVGAVSRKALAGAALCFLLIYSPWPIRNLARFGAPHPLGGVCDIAGDIMPHTAYFGWFATWLVDEQQTPNTLYCLMRRTCVATLHGYPDEAFDDAEEREFVQKIFRLRAAQGDSDDVDRAFRSLARRRLVRHPLRTLVLLPLRRAYHQWISRNDQPIQVTRTLPWPRLFTPLYPHLRKLSTLLLLLGLLGILVLFLLRRRGPALVAALALCSRAAFLSLIGFVDARYVLELHPLLAVLAAVALIEGGRRLGRIFFPGKPESDI